MPGFAGQKGQTRGRSWSNAIPTSPNSRPGIFFPKSAEGGGRCWNGSRTRRSSAWASATPPSRSRRTSWKGCATPRWRSARREGYSGYDDDPKGQALLQNLKSKFPGSGITARSAPEEIFISDGAKCDCGRLQMLFGSEVTIAVQDPAYPVYVDGSVIAGATGAHNPERGQFDGLVYLPCTPANDFFPNLSALAPHRPDLLLLAEQPHRRGFEPRPVGTAGFVRQTQRVDHHFRRRLLPRSSGMTACRVPSSKSKARAKSRWRSTRFPRRSGLRACAWAGR